MAGSSIPAFKVALLARLEAALTDIQVSYGHPHPKRSENDMVVIGGAVSTQEYVGVGTTARREEYQVEIIVIVNRPIQEVYQTLEARAFVIVALVEADLILWAADQFDQLVTTAKLGSMEVAEAVIPDTSGSIVEREASITMKVDVRARI